MTKLFAAMMLTLVATFGTAYAGDDLGPAVGTKMPDIGTPSDQTGTPRTMASLMGEKGVVFLFFRSAAW